MGNVHEPAWTRGGYGSFLMWFAWMLVGCGGLLSGGDGESRPAVLSLSDELPGAELGYGPGDGVHRGLTWTPDGFLPLEVQWEDGVIRSVVSIASVPPGERTRLTPGFIDAHGHPASLGNQLAELNVQGIDSYQATLKAIEGALDMGPWISGRGWDQNDWLDGPEGGWSLASDLDALTACVDAS